MVEGPVELMLAADAVTDVPMVDELDGLGNGVVEFIQVALSNRALTV